MVVPSQTSSVLVEERANEENSSIRRKQRVLKLVEIVLLAPVQFRLLRLRVRNPRDRIANQQLLALRHGRRRDGVVDRDPAGRREE